jgi:SAM-dependent methyltransferase
MTNNQQQTDYWSSDAGLKWIRFEKELDTVFEAVNAALIQRANPQPGEHVLDIGCGTGATAREFSVHLAPGGSITALDISEPLLLHARSRADECAVKSQYQLVDAQNDLIPQAPFDLVTSRFGVMFFSDPVVAFSNIRDHLKPEGRLVVVAWAKITGNPWFEAPRDGAVARLGPLDASRPHAPGPLGFQDVERVSSLLRDAGFQNVIAEEAEVILSHPGPLDDVAALASNIGPAARVLKKYNGGPEDVEAIKNYVSKKFKEFETNQAVRIPAQLNFFYGENSI